MKHGWRLAVEQKADLRVSDEDLAELTGAVRRGADLGLYLITEQYEETLYFQQTYVGEDNAFAGLMSHHHSYDPHGQDIQQPYISIFKYDTSGAFCHMKWMWDDVALDESQAYPYGVYRWFVCDHWRLVYEHDAEGRCVFGNLEELKEHVRQGHSIQVGIRQLFGLAEDDVNGPSHISFVTTMQPVIRNGHVHFNCDLVAVGAPKWPCT